MDIIAQIDDWARRLPEKPAHISGDRSLTYGELRRQSDSLAAWLAARFPGARPPIAILGHREPEVVAGFLGCVKAGMPYIPCDTALPPQRLAPILAAAALTLTAEEIAGIVRTDRPAPGIEMGRDDFWYIIFTSGSTGAPKGVPITRGCLETFMAWLLAEQCFIEGEEVFLNQAPFSFDISGVDLYGAFMTGGTIFSLSRDVQVNPRLLYQALSRSNATFSICTPSFARLCMSEPTYHAAMLPRLRKFFLCGENLPPGTVAQLMERFPAAEVWNAYGPTEATIVVTSIRYDAGILRRYPALLPIGKVMPAVTVWLIDENLQPVPAEGRGEIVIAGPLVTPGYLNAPERNAAAFVFHNGLRGYRTGDYGYFRDGFLFCEGRMDDQIKLNGYRIELGDIESNLRKLTAVHEAVVAPVLKDGMAQSLTAFVHLAEARSRPEFEITAELKTALLERLPAYMLPRKFVYVDHFPMTPNGKVDRRQLAAAQA